MRGLSARVEGLLAPRLEAARAAGVVGDGTAVEDLMTALAMIDGALAAQADRNGREAAARRALNIVLDGIRSRR